MYCFDLTQYCYSRKDLRYRVGWVVLVGFLFSSSLVIARDGVFVDVSNHRIGRYVAVSTHSTPIQMEPLIEVVDFAPKGTTVGAAMREVLTGTGYGVDESVGLPGFDVLALPRVHRSFTHTQIIEIVRALAGPAYLIGIDPVTRVIRFQLAMESSTER